jgi:hypothetical protein
MMYHKWERSPKETVGTGRPYYAQILIKRKGRIVHREAQTFDRRQAAKAWLARRETELAQPGALKRGPDPSFTRPLIDTSTRPRRRSATPRRRCSARSRSCMPTQRQPIPRPKFYPSRWRRTENEIFDPDSHRRCRQHFGRCNVASSPGSLTDPVPGSRAHVPCRLRVPPATAIPVSEGFTRRCIVVNISFWVK